MQLFQPTIQHVVRGLLAINLTLLIAGAVGLLILHARGEQLLSVQTASMAPTFQPGDALIVGPARVPGLRVGDIISYRNLQAPSLTVTHRLVAIDQRTGWLTTAGDALHSPDPAFPRSQIIGHVTARAPGLGHVLNWLRGPIGLIISVYVPALLIIAREVQRLNRTYARPFYSVRL